MHTFVSYRIVLANHIDRMQTRAERPADESRRDRPTLRSTKRVGDSMQTVERRIVLANRIDRMQTRAERPVDKSRRDRPTLRSTNDTRRRSVGAASRAVDDDDVSALKALI